MIIDINYWSRVIKNILFLIISILAIFFSFKLAFFYLPFLIAFIISLMLEYPIKWIMKKFKLKRKTSSIIVFILAIAIIIGFLTWIITTLISETSDLMLNFNKYVDLIYNTVQNLIKNIDFNKIQIPANVMNTIENSAIEFLGTITQFAKNILTNAINFITSIPTIGIYVVITILALYFICIDKIYILDQMEHHLPQTWVKKIGIHIRGITKAVGAYLKAQVVLIFISFVISIIGLFIYHFIGLNVEYPLTIAIIIGFVDALPIFGSGTIMVPWAIFSGVMGDFKLGIAILVLWIIMSIVRQIIEPKIVSEKIGIHPIFTLVAMYTGFKFVGISGMIIGPIVLIILKNIYGTLIDKGVVKTLLER